MASSLSPILTVVKEILQTAGRKGMHASEIAQAAIAQNKNMDLPSDELQKKMLAALAANLKLKTSKPSFAQVSTILGSVRASPSRVGTALRRKRPRP